MKIKFSSGKNLFFRGEKTREEIDENILPLVEVLQECGFETLGSCGGHKNPTEIQQPYGKFFVSFKSPEEDILLDLEEMCKKNGVEIECYTFEYEGHKSVYDWVIISGETERIDVLIEKMRGYKKFNEKCCR